MVLSLKDHLAASKTIQDSYINIYVCVHVKNIKANLVSILCDDNKSYTENLIVFSPGAVSLIGAP